MPYFSNLSFLRLEACHPDLIEVANEAIKDCPIDFGIVSGHRSQPEQFALFKKGRVKKFFKWVILDKSKVVTYNDGYKNKSKHNHKPSRAFDIIAYVNGKYTYETKYYVFIGAWILAKAKEKNINITWGGNFDRDGDIMEGTFNDLGHFQL